MVQDSCFFLVDSFDVVSELFSSDSSPAVTSRGKYVIFPTRRTITIAKIERSYNYNIQVCTSYVFFLRIICWSRMMSSTGDFCVEKKIVRRTVRKLDEIQLL